MTPGRKFPILDLPAKLRQLIYDYIFSDAGDKRIAVTLDQNNTLSFHNGATIRDLRRTCKTVNCDVLGYLFDHITFVLTDDQRTCLHQSSQLSSEP